MISFKRLSLVTLLGAAFMSTNSFADTCSLVAGVDSEGNPPMSWNDGERLGDYRASNRTLSCTNVPAGSSITRVVVGFHYIINNTTVSLGKLPHGDYTFTIVGIKPDNSNLSARGSFNVSTPVDAKAGEKTNYATSVFNDMDPNDLTFSGAAQVLPDGTNFPCNNIGSSTICDNWMQVTFDYQITYTPPAPDPIAPDVPSFVNASVSGGDVTISWGAVNAATRYEREVRINGGSWTNLRSYNHPQTSVVFGNQEPRSYQYRVRACDELCSNWRESNVVQVQIQPPASVSAQVQNNDDVFISWAASRGATQYIREVSVNGGGYQNPTTFTGTTATFYDQLVRSYRYRVKACQGAQCSAWAYSNTVQVTTPGTPGPVSAQVNGNDVTISWSYVRSAQEYQREVSINGGGWQNLKTYPVSQTSVVFANQQSRTYQYRVRACHSGNCSAWQTSNSVTVP